jgi:hypothetical protein
VVVTGSRAGCRAREGRVVAPGLSAGVGDAQPRPGGRGTGGLFRGPTGPTLTLTLPVPSGGVAGVPDEPSGIPGRGSGGPVDADGFGGLELMTADPS